MFTPAISRGRRNRPSAIHHLKGYAKGTAVFPSSLSLMEHSSVYFLLSVFTPASRFRSAAKPGRKSGRRSRPVPKAGPFPSQPDLSSGILSCERMELSRYVSDVLASHIIFLGRGTPSLLFHIYKRTLFMYPAGAALLFSLRGFMGMRRYIQRGAPGFSPCSHSLHHAEDDTRWPGLPGTRTVAVCIGAVCQSAGDERSRRIASRLLKPMSNGEKGLASR